jgi:superfamily II helicase
LNHLIEANRLGEVGILVVDEAHTISVPDRGFHLEMLVSKVKFLCPSVQILCA